MSAKTLTRREADVFACVVDTIVAPAGGMPPVRETDAVEAFAHLLTRSPVVNAVGLRVILYLLDAAPRAFGMGARLRRLDRARRVEVVGRLLRSPARPLLEGVRAVATFSYYGDDAVAARFGWDPDAVVARGRALRTAEARW